MYALIETNALIFPKKKTKPYTLDSSRSVTERSVVSATGTLAPNYYINVLSFTNINYTLCPKPYTLK